MGKHGAHLITSADLMRSGWRVTPGCDRTGGDRIVVGGRVASGAEVSGVYVRMRYVLPEELADIADDDRDYVSAEMSSFLFAWLSTLRCPVVNPPAEGCLSGPAWPGERWTLAAGALAIPVVGLTRHVRGSEGEMAFEPDRGELRSVVVVGDEVIGEATARQAAQARRLARHAGTVLLKVVFECGGKEARLLYADPFPDPVGVVADAVLGVLAAGGRF